MYQLTPSILQLVFLFQKMVRNYQRKTERGKTPLQTFERAYESVKTKEMTLREAATFYEIDKMTLHRFIRRKDQSNEPIVKVGYAKPRQIFTDQLEVQLKDYLLHCSKIYYGLTPKNIKELAYELAEANRHTVNIPDSWINNKCATAEWFTCFMKRHPRLSLREPEGTSLSRATSFNRTNVNNFFDNLQSVLDKHKFENKDVWNVDETSVQTVQRPNKIVAEKGTRQVAKATSAERGQTVTMAIGVNAVGNAIPPMFIFPRVFFKDHFVRNGPPGCTGTAYPTGWMTGSSFLLFMKHFHSNVRSSKENPVLLILDNHESHLSVDVLSFCKDNGIVMLSFPPHTSNRLQPLDVSVFGPFKRFYFSAVDNWMTSNPGKTVTIYDIPGIVKVALPNALTQRNIVSGFEATGIMPFNRNIFTDSDFLSSSVTDRPLREIDQFQPSSTIDISSTQTNSHDSPRGQPEGNANEMESIPSTSSGINVPIALLVSPQDIRPYPKAGDRKVSNKGKKPMKSAILTSTPVKEQLEVAAREKEKKKVEKLERARKKLCKSLGFESKQSKDKKVLASNEKKKKQIPKKRIKKERESESEDDEDTLCLVCLKPYLQSKPGQDWIQCISCKKWAHIECGKDSKVYTCIHCASDLEFSDAE